MFGNVATGPGLPKENPRPWEGILPPARDSLTRGVAPNPEECETVPPFKLSLTQLINAGSASPAVTYGFPETYKIPRHVVIYRALLFHRPYFWARRNIAIALSDGTLYAGPKGWTFKESAFTKGANA